MPLFARRRSLATHACKALLYASLLCTAIGLSGCRESSFEFREVKRPDEKISEEELQQFLRIVKLLPDAKLTTLPTVLLPPPAWSPDRTLPVNELVNEERTSLNNHWTVEWLVRHMRPSRSLNRALRREEMTPEQFVGLTLALGAAVSRSTIDDAETLEKTLEDGKQYVAQLEPDNRPFNSLTREGQHLILRRAAWVTRIDRAERLSRVPPENIALVRDHRKELGKMLPKEFTTNPLESIVDTLQEHGMPFEESRDSGLDGQIEWRREEAIIGNDPPDPELEPLSDRDSYPATN